MQGWVSYSPRARCQLEGKKTYLKGARKLTATELCHGTLENALQEV